MDELSSERKTVKQNQKRSQRKLSSQRQPIIATAIYSRAEAAIVAGCAVITLIRAFSAGHLSGYRVGRHLKHSGQHLIDWLESGGKTGVKGGRANA